MKSEDLIKSSSYILKVLKGGRRYEVSKCNYDQKLKYVIYIFAFAESMHNSNILYS